MVFKVIAKMKKIIEQIKKYIPINWPLQSFIAVNPLFDLTTESIDSALLAVSRYTDIKGALRFDEYHQYYRDGKISLANLEFAVSEFSIDKHCQDYKGLILKSLSNPLFQEELEKVDVSVVDFSVNLFAKRALVYTENDNQVKRQVVAFCNDFFDLGQAKWNMPISEDRLFPAWLKYSCIDDRRFVKILRNISDQPLDALTELLLRLGIPLTSWHDYLSTVAFQMLGWASVIKWLESRPDNPYFSKKANLEDLLAIWLAYELLLKEKYAITYEEVKLSDNNLAILELLKNYSLPEDIASNINKFHLGLIWQRAYEHSYQEQLINQIKSVPKIINNADRPSAQAVFCIDTRSEGIRRHFESMGNYQTYGFAGFFGVGFKLVDNETHNCSLQCPAIVVPDKTLINKPVKNSFLLNSWNLFASAINKSKSGFFSPFVLFDAIGGWFSTTLLGKTFFPEPIYRYVKDLRKKLGKNDEFSNKSLDVFAKDGGFTHEGIAESLSFVFKAIGLTENFAPFVIIAGHKAESQNNPFQSSLDCGACGGNGGIPNAIAFCQAANNSQVRRILSEKFSINIPDDTVFISSCHLTTTDEFEYYNLDTMSNLQGDEFVKVKSDINSACQLLRLERMMMLNNDDSPHVRQTNWAELIPEIALANNAAFIIGPRQITANLQLQRRTFLHSYEPAEDSDGKILSFILNAPVLVGHWINSQYYFSSTDHELYGSGNKAIHNVVGGFGVMEGNFSDFKIGLPIQSLSCLDSRVHEPMRLLVVIYANRSLVNRILEESPTVANIFDGRWAHLVVIDPDEIALENCAKDHN
jgi:uncharacterized protein YbcC (UPF0753/DUF2309 family)